MSELYVCSSSMSIHMFKSVLEMVKLYQLTERLIIHVTVVHVCAEQQPISTTVPISGDDEMLNLFLIAQ